MAYALSFAPNFFRDEQQSKKPTSVEQAIAQLSADAWHALALEVFDCDPDQLTIDAVLRKVEETNTCLNLDSPVEVCIDPDGEFTLLVFDKSE